jgi:cell division inhibitor SulA
MHRSKSKNALGTVGIFLLALALTACGGGGGGGEDQAAAQSETGSTDVTAGSTSNTGSTKLSGPPSIYGVPNRQALANQPYWFRPVASDPDGDPLVFGVVNQPHWSAFNTATGELTGTPTMADIGLYRGVSLTVTAAGQMRALSFDVEVLQVGTRSVTLSWIPPTENEDGTPLLNLAGYRIRYGLQSGNYTNVVTLNNPGLATYVLSGLATGTYHIVISALNANGLESAYSNEASKTLS